MGTRTPGRALPSIDGAGTTVGRAGFDGSGAPLPGRTSGGTTSAATRPSTGATATGTRGGSWPPPAAVGTGCPGVTRATGVRATPALRVCTPGTAPSADLDITRLGVDGSTAGGRPLTRGSVVRLATLAASSRMATRKEFVLPAFAAPAPVTVNPGDAASTAVGASAVAEAAAAGGAGAATGACGDATLGEAGTSDAGWAAGAGAAGCGDGTGVLGGAAAGTAGKGAAAEGAATGAGDCAGGGAGAGIDRGGSRSSGST